MNAWRTIGRWTAVAVTVAALGAVLAACKTTATPKAADKLAAPPLTLDQAFAQLPTYAQGGSSAALNIVEAAATQSTGRERAAVAARLAALLAKPGTTADAKSFICRQLRVSAGAAEVPAIAPLLRDPELSHMARYALERLPAPEAGAALRQALAATDGRLRVGIVNSLGERREAEAVPAITALLTQPDPETAAAAAAALGKIGTPAAAQALQKALSTAADSARPGLQDGLLSCADRLLRGGQPQVAAGYYQDTFKTAATPLIRIAALQGIVTATGQDSVALLSSLLAGDDPALRGAAVQYARSLPGKDTTLKLASQLSKLPPAAQRLLADALAARGDHAARPAVERLLVSSTDSTVRTAAIAALRELGEPASVPLLARLAAQGPETERGTARDSLARLRDAGGDAAMMQAIPTEPPAVVAELVRALAARRCRAAVPVFLKRATHADAGVRAESLRALASVPSRRDLPAVVALLTAARTDDERDLASKAVVAACQDGPNPQGQTAPVVAALTGAKPETRAALHKTLGRVGGAPALAAVRKGLTDPAADVRAAAARALCDWPDATALPDVLRLAKSADDEVTRVLALRGCVRLLALPSDRAPQETLRLYEATAAAARRPEDRKLVIAALGQSKDPALLPLAKRFLGTEGAADEAAQAVTALASALAPNDRAGAEAAIRLAGASVQTESVQAQCRAALESLTAFDDFVTTWLLAGPYTQSGTKGRDLQDVVFAPENPGTPGVTWRVVRPAGAPSETWLVDLAATLNTTDCCAYMRTWIRCPEAGKIRLEMGSDDGIKVWFNDAVVLAKKVDRGIRRGEDVVTVDAKQGWNSLVLKVMQGGGGWSGCARIRREDGGRLTGWLLLGTADGLVAARKDVEAGSPDVAATAAAALTEWPEPVDALRAVLGVAARGGRLGVPAGTAAVRLASGLADTDPALAREALTRVTQATADDEVRRTATGQLEQMRERDDYIQSWYVAGPYTKDGADTAVLFDTVFAPEGRSGDGDVTWRTLAATPGSGVTWWVDLVKVVGGEMRVAYLRNFVYSPDSREAVLEVGTDDGVKVWLNGVVVHANNAARGLKPGEDKVPVRLEKGWNSLMLKVVQGRVSWGACARFRRPDGRPFGDLQPPAPTPERKPAAAAPGKTGR